MATPNPMARTYPDAPSPVSKKTIIVAGIITTVYGLEELQPNVTKTACLWLLHGRL